MQVSFKTHIRQMMTNNSKSYAVIIPSVYFQSLPNGLSFFDTATIRYGDVTITLNDARISKRPSTYYFPIKKEEVDGKIPINTVVDVDVGF